MVAMPYTQQYLGGEGANMSNFFVATPICCPSRSTLLSGKFNHNNRGPAGYSGCMNMNVSRTDNPEWWEDTLVAKLRRDHGYAVGMFGKVLNVMDSYGCKPGFKTPHVDRFLVMCNHNFFNETWADDRDPHTPGPPGTNVALNKTAAASADYTTSIIGNASIAWMKSVIESGPDHPPFFAYLGPHAPHKPSQPAAWYADHPIANTPIVKDPYYNYWAQGKHAFLPLEPAISAVDEAAIQYEYGQRLRTLLSVDDVVRGIHSYLDSVGEWERTYFLFTSDHGYNLGQFRVDSDKTQVYDHNTRVPMLFKGPGIPHGIKVPIVSSMADIAPTLLELVGANNIESEQMDGTSFAPQLAGTAGAGAAGFGRTATLVEYVNGGEENKCSKPMALPAPQNATCHWHDGPNNTFSSLRIIAPQTGDLMYAEFVNGHDPSAHFFPPNATNFFELYNMYEGSFLKEKFALEDAIGSHACVAQQHTSRGCILSQLDTVNYVSTLKDNRLFPVAQRARRSKC
jgi:N-acetylglucosamine-6-sulfatase